MLYLKISLNELNISSNELKIYSNKLDIIVIGTITGAPLLPFCALVTEA